MSDEVAIICSRADPASLNIAERLLKLAAWEDRGGYSSSGPWRLVIHDQRQTALRDLDVSLADLGLHPEVVVFACRHESKRGVPWFGGHFTGTLEDGCRQLSAAAPSGLRSFLLNIRRLAPPGFRISAEATHHGPTDMRTPSFFAEIGSGESQWRDTRAGEAVARAILGLQADELPVSLGFGGGHYVPRQTDLMFGADIAFGHLFSTHQTGFLDAELVEEARSKSGASYAYMDRKSLPSGEKRRIAAILDDLGIPVLKGKEILARFPPSKRPADEMKGVEGPGLQGRSGA